jgi:hypothetical protein
MSEAKSRDPFAEFQTIHLKNASNGNAINGLTLQSSNTDLILSYKFHKIQFYTPKIIKIMQFAQ